MITRAMPRRFRPKAAGKNDIWFAAFFIVAIVVMALIPHHEPTSSSSRPAPIPAADIKD